MWKSDGSSTNPFRMDSAGSASTPFQRALSSLPDRGRSVELLDVFSFRGELAAGRYRLSNGLVLILMYDPRAPVFAYHTWMRVGSKHESPSRTGVAHLLEHLMFKATANNPAGLFDREMERRGAETNAATWVDWTYYHQVLANRGDNLPTVVDFEVDRLRNLVFEPDAFAAELEVVCNERRMSIDDSAFGALGEAVYSEAFRSHPYRCPTIGRGEHLASMELSDVKPFYDDFYRPEQAVVVVVGDIDVADTLRLLVSKYASLESHGASLPQAKPEPVQDETRHVEIGRPVHAPYVTLAFHAPAQSDPMYAALEGAAEVLFVGDNARLYKRLVTRERVAADVEGYLTPFAEPGLCEITVALRKGVDTHSVVDLVREELERVALDLTEAEVDKAHNGLELAFFDALRDADGLAEALGHAEVCENDYRHAFDMPARIELLSVDSIADACRACFRPENCTIGIVRPDGQ